MLSAMQYIIVFDVYYYVYWQYLCVLVINWNFAFSQIGLLFSAIISQANL